MDNCTYRLKLCHEINALTFELDKSSILINRLDLGIDKKALNRNNIEVSKIIEILDREINCIKYRLKYLKRDNYIE